MSAKDFGNDPLSTPQPGTAVRDSRVAMEIQRGVTRLLLDLGLTAIAEFTLANGRRADVAALARDGELWIVEIKFQRRRFSVVSQFEIAASRFL